MANTAELRTKLVLDDRDARSKADAFAKDVKNAVEEPIEMGIDRGTKKTKEYTRKADALEEKKFREFQEEVVGRSIAEKKWKIEDEYRRKYAPEHAKKTFDIYDDQMKKYMAKVQSERGSRSSFDTALDEIYKKRGGIGKIEESDLESVFDDAMKVALARDAATVREAKTNLRGMRAEQLVAMRYAKKEDGDDTAGGGGMDTGDFSSIASMFGRRFMGKAAIAGLVYGVYNEINQSVQTFRNVNQQLTEYSAAVQGMARMANIQAGVMELSERHGVKPSTIFPLLNQLNQTGMTATNQFMSADAIIAARQGGLMNEQAGAAFASHLYNTSGIQDPSKYFNRLQGMKERSGGRDIAPTAQFLQSIQSQAVGRYGNYMEPGVAEQWMTSLTPPGQAPTAMTQQKASMMMGANQKGSLYQTIVIRELLKRNKGMSYIDAMLQANEPTVENNMLYKQGVAGMSGGNQQMKKLMYMQAGFDTKGKIAAMDEAGVPSEISEKPFDVSIFKGGKAGETERTGAELERASLSEVQATLVSAGNLWVQGKAHFMGGLGSEETKDAALSAIPGVGAIHEASKQISESASVYSEATRIFKEYVIKHSEPGSPSRNWIEAK